METFDFEALMATHKPFVAKICAGFASDAMELDDLVQEVFIQIWKKIHQFRGDAKLSTWIYRVTVNICLYHVSQEKKRNTRVMDEDHIAQRIEKEQQSAIDVDLTAKLYNGIKKLDPLDRAIIMLYLEKKTHEEIGHILGQTSTNVGVRIHRCKQKLKEILNERD